MPNLNPKPSKKDEGRWTVYARGNSWWIHHPTRKDIRIGPIDYPERKNYDKAVAAAEKRNKVLEKKNPLRAVPGGSVTACIKRMKKRKAKRGSPRDPGALCAWIADQREPGWRSGPRKSTKRKTRKNTMKMTTTPRRKTMSRRKLNQGYVITSRGLEASKKLVGLRKGMEVFFGASSSPELIKIVKLEKDTIHYRSELDDRTRKIQRYIGEDLIAQGTTTWLRSGFPQYFPAKAKKLRKLVGDNPAKKSPKRASANPKKATPARKANPKKRAAPIRKANPRKRVAKRNPRSLAALTKI